MLLRVRDIYQDQYEGTALMYRLVDHFGRYFAPTLYMENVKIDGRWHTGPVIANHFGHWDAECITLGIEPVRGDHVATFYKALGRVDDYLEMGSGGGFPVVPFEQVARELGSKFGL